MKSSSEFKPTMVFHLPTWGSILDGVLSIDSVEHSTILKTWLYLCLARLYWQFRRRLDSTLHHFHWLRFCKITDIIPLLELSVCCVLALAVAHWDSSNSLHSPLTLDWAESCHSPGLWLVSPRLSWPLIGWSALWSGSGSGQNINGELGLTRV